MFEYPQKENSYITRFQEKIARFKDHPRYSWLDQYARDAVYYFDETGPFLVKAEDFIKRILEMDEEFIRMWLDGKHLLKWDEWHIWRNKKQMYDPQTLCELFVASDYDALSYICQFCIGEQKMLVMDLMATNDRYFTKGEEPPLSEVEYHKKKWDLFQQFGVRKDDDGEMIPVEGGRKT